MKQNEYRRGVTEVLVCMVLWGVLPVYWQALRPIGSWVIIFYRIFLVSVFAALFARTKYTWKEIFAPMKDRKLVLRLFLAGVIITANWSIYIYGVNADHVIQCSIGYYIEPLMMCLFSIFLFHEKVTKYNLTAMILACVSIIIILIHFGEVPEIALLLALSFSVYAAIKKGVTLPAMISLVYETIFLAPIALAVIIYIEVSGKGALQVGVPYKFILLLLCGIVTVIPLSLFGSAAQKVSFFILALAEYVSPTISLILGIFFMKEPFDRVQLLAFAIIWIGIIFFSRGEFLNYKKTQEDGK